MVNVEHSLVDVTIAVHTRTRPISRAVASVLEHNSAQVRVNVVAHNIDAEIIRTNLGRYGDDPRVRLLHLDDGIPSPAGPLNHGLAASDGDYVSVMGSDDELAPGAIDSWLDLQKSTRAAMVIARIDIVGQSTVASPPVRPFHRGGLDAVKDRLSYRSAPLGLIAREAFGELRFAEGLSSGEDLPYVLKIWFSGEKIVFDRTGPAYRVHSDEGDRVTSTPRPVRDDFGFLDRVLDDPWFERLDRRQRRALAIKLIRTHLFDAVLNRVGQTWSSEERSDLASAARRIVDWGHHPDRLLSWIDRDLLEAILDDADTPSAVMRRLVERRSRYTSLPAIATRNPFLVLRRQAPFRTLAAGYLVQR